MCTTFLGFKQSYGLSLAAYGVVMNCSQPSPSKESVYDYTVMDIMNDLNISLSVFTNRVLVITNTASFSDLTAPHYLGLNALKSKFDDQPFEILAFSCNNFELVSTNDKYKCICI